MLFGRKNDSEKISQMKAAVEESVAEAFRQQAQEQSRQQEKQQAHLDEILEKNHKAVRNLADTVEDFLDSMEEEDRQQRQSRQEWISRNGNKDCWNWWDFISSRWNWSSSGWQGRRTAKLPRRHGNSSMPCSGERL